MNLDFEKLNGLIPVIIQDAQSMNVLMLGFMNKEAYEKTLNDKIVTFYSRSKKRLWTKGETSGNFLKVVDIKIDCDKDTLLIKVNPTGPVCHTGTDTCFDEKNEDKVLFLQQLQQFIDNRKQTMPENSYTTELFKKGINKIAQKVGEEAVELIIEAKDNNDELFLNESADLFYHILVLLSQKGLGIKDVVNVLKQRNNKYLSN